MDISINREVKGLLRRGVESLAKRDYERALAYFRKAYTLDPENVTALVNLGYTYVRMGKFSHARKCFTTALDFDPDNPVARKNLTLLMRPDQSNRQYRPRYRPRGEEEIYIKYIQWGTFHLEAKNYYAAVQYFESASSIHPDFIEPYMKIGICFESLGEYSRALEPFEEALTIYPKDAVVQEHLHRCLEILETGIVPPISEDPKIHDNGIETEVQTQVLSPKAAKGKYLVPIIEQTHPQSDDQFMKDIMDQYSVLLGKQDNSSKEQKELDYSVDANPKTVESAGSAGMNDTVRNILMQYQDDNKEGPETMHEGEEERKVMQTEGDHIYSGKILSGKSQENKKLELSDSQKDALRELGNIGASHAATTLSTMLDTPIMMNVPEINIIDFEGVVQQIAQEEAAMVIFTMEGQVSKAGYVLLHVPRDSVVLMTGIMLGLPTEPGRELNEMDESGINEIGNIMVSAFLDGTAELLGIIMLPSPPRTIFDTPRNVFSMIIEESNIRYDSVVFFKTELICAEHQLNLNIIMLPNPPVLHDIIQMLEKIIEDSAP